MPNPVMHTDFDLRQPPEKEALRKAVRKYAKRKKPFTNREMCETIKCTTVQGRNILGELIADGTVTYEGTTRDMTYRRAAA